MVTTFDKGRKELAAIIAIAVLPFLIGAFLFTSFPREDMPDQTVREGIEITQEITISSLIGDGKWRLIHLVEDVCDEQCREALFLTRQTRKALSKHAGELRRVALTAGDLRPNFLEFLAQEHRALSLVSDDEIFAKLIVLVPDGIEANFVFLVDPIGKVVMFFPFEKLGKPLLRDLRYILRSSRMG
ncbi:MAG: hypothetical protein CMP95_03110 [Gammaproteobacteria bacterium]|nr:hypothetical protein [Gammaproteobacteria bacterium]OUV68392.1 MAG: hypothetical protein CBC93_01525 [Gammaproteobacteria bacterium TMED133]